MSWQRWGDRDGQTPLAPDRIRDEAWLIAFVVCDAGLLWLAWLALSR